MKNKILIYDDNCPLCCWYSGEFVRFGFLTEDGRKAFSSLDPSLLSRIDFEKSRNEIPLLDTENGQVLYGIDALLEILDSKIPFIKKGGNIPPVKWFIKKLYKFISCNRKVIVAKKCGSGTIDCAPDLNYFYRFVFMLVFLLMNTAMLFPLHHIVFTKLSYYSLSIFQMQAAHFVFVIINCSLAFSLSKEKAYEYLGQVNMLAVITIAALIPLMLLNLFIQNEWMDTLYLVFLAAVIFKEYIRRMDYAGILIKNKWLVSINLLALTGFFLYVFN